MGLLQSSESVFIVGIKGVAMAGLARMLSQMGKKVSGSDTLESQITDGILSELRMANGACPPLVEITDHLPSGVDLVVYSAAHGGVESAQVQEAVRCKIPIISQAALIAELIKMYPISIAVCGCHGKTGTSALLAYTLSQLGAKVSWLVGAPYFRGKVQSTKYRVQGTEDVNLGGEKTPARLWQEAITQTTENTFPGGHFEEGSEIFVFEADEYGVDPPHDKTPKILLYHPTHIICTNIDFDHPDIFEDIDHVRRTFHEFFTHTPNVYQCQSTSIEGNRRGIMALLHDLGYDLAKAQQVMDCFGGVARRLESHGERDGVLYIDDYGHHPAEIKTTIETLRSTYDKRRIIVLFQSHTHSRTIRLKHQFVEALALADIALIDRVFPSAREFEGAGDTITPRDLAHLAHEKGYINVMGLDTREELVRRARDLRRPGDIILTLGAGDIYTVIPTLMT